MARKDELIKSKSIYTLRKRHAVTTAGTIYENDYTTITSNDNVYDDDMVFFSDSNFKYRVGKGDNSKKKHSRGEWVGPNNETEYWNKEDLKDYVKSEETKIINKPNYSSLKDFAYYGSAVELIKATVNDVILRFPGGISYYNSEYAPKIFIPDENDSEHGTTYNLISNEFDIDFWTQGNVSNNEVKNPLRVLAASYKLYEGYKSPTEKVELHSPIFNCTSECPNSIIGTVKLWGNSGDTSGVFLVYMDNVYKKHLITTTEERQSTPIIRPKQEIIDNFWETLDDFERILLNRNSKPVYKATFDTPYQEDDGFFYSSKDYVWPTIEDGENAFTPDMTTANFQGYLQSLISLAQFHDEYDSDNIWRMMTHESIKNLDWSFTQRDNIDDEESKMDSSKIEAMIHVWGRQFDDIKRYADNIKSSNNVSYDERNNVPDYFLTDVIENDGWDSKSVSPTDDNLLVNPKPSDANINFLRRLALSSNYIQSKKGTRAGIESILQMFGYKEDKDGSKKAGTYKIDEFICVATNALAYRDIGYIRASCDYVLYDENTNLMDGYPVIVLDPTGEGDETKYKLMPWFDKYVKYKYPMYFQSKGGWGKMKKLKINLPITTETEINGTFYKETEPYLRFADNIEEMLSLSNNELENGMVCYVVDISGMDKYSEKPKDDDSYSHYFILRDRQFSYLLGKNDRGCTGWENIYTSQFSEKGKVDEDGKKVLYLESLIANYNGNNPHTGRGKYDDGNEYLDKFRRLFKDAVENGIYDDMKGTEDWDKLNITGFTIEGPLIHNNKCQYFYNGVWSTDGESIITGNYPFYNLMGGETYEEDASYSVVNVKNLRITFNTNGNQYLKDYFINVVLRYLEPMIPSTAILEYKFDSDPVTTPSTMDSFSLPSNISEITAHGVLSENGTDYYADSEFLDKN